MHNHNYRMLIFLIGFTAMVCSAFPESRAEEIFQGDYSFDARLGYHHANVNGYRGKVGEYEVLDSGMEGDFTLKAETRKNYFDLGGDIKDKNDQHYNMNFDTGRIYQTETSYTRFKHYLDHDPLTNQDFFTDFDAGSTNAIVREEFASENTFRIPLIPNLNINADFRQLNKRGHRQATTVSHCNQCHVTSRDRRINQTTEDVKVGAEMTIRNVTFNYNHTQRSYNEGGADPIAYYGFPDPSFSVKGFDRYSAVSDSRTHVNSFETKAELPLQSSFSFDYEIGENSNRDTRNDREYESFAMRLTTASLHYVTFNFSYFDYDSDSDAPGSMDKDMSRSTISFRTRPWKKNFIRGSYRWEDIDRRGTDVRSTSREILNIAFCSRPYRTVDFTIRYTNERTDDPFANKEVWGLFRSEQTSLPTSSDEVQLSLNWNPRGNLSLSSTLLYVDADSSRYDIDEERLEMIFSMWYAPRDNLILVGSYGMIHNEIDTRSAYKTYHGVWLTDFSTNTRTVYDDRSNYYNLMVNYRFARNIALVSNLTFADSQSDFDASVYNNNVGEFSDLKIERLDASLGIDYLYKPNLSFYSKYNYRDYNDREMNHLDGKLHFISFGVNYLF